MAVKVFLNQLCQDVIDFIQNNAGTGEGGAGLTEEIISNITVGGAPSGTVFQKNQTFTDFAKAILLTTIAPKITTSFSGAGVKEKGDILSGTTITLKIDNIPQITVPLNEINFYMGNTLIGTLPYKSGQDTYSFKYTKNITDDITGKAELVYDTNKKVSGSGIFTFVYPSYYGVTNLASIDTNAANNLIKSFTKVLKTNKNLTWNNINLNDEKFCYMYPASYGALGSIKDGNGFNQLDGYTQSTVNITHPKDGKTIKYNVYLLTDPATGSGFTQIYQ